MTDHRLSRSSGRNKGKILNTNLDLPTYVEIQRALEAQIMSGAWPPGHPVPIERELQEQYACSRMTVSKALSALASAGLIVRRRRAGSFVAPRTSEETILEIHDIKAEITASGKRHSHKVNSSRIRSASAQDMQRFNVAAGIPVMALEVIHFADDRPFVLEDRLLNLKAVPEARAEAFQNLPPGSWLLARIPWTDATHVIRAGLASATVAGKLDVRKGAPCLLVERNTWRLGSPITFVRLTYPGDRHRLIGRFNPASK